MFCQSQQHLEDTDTHQHSLRYRNTAPLVAWECLRDHFQWWRIISIQPLTSPRLFCLVDQFYLILIISQLQFFGYCHPTHSSFEEKLGSQVVPGKRQLSLVQATQPLRVILWTRTNTRTWDSEPLESAAIYKVAWLKLMAKPTRFCPPQELDLSNNPKSKALHNE